MENKFARIDANHGNTCAEFVEFNPIGRFHPSLHWVGVPDNLKEYVDNNYVLVDEEVTPPTAEYLANQIRSRIAAFRWRVQNGGIVVGDVTVLTSDHDYTMLKGAIESLQEGDIQDTDWKSSVGWISVRADDLSTLISYRKSIAEHYRAAFKRERTLSNQIDVIIQAADAGVLDQLLAIDWKSGWPETIKTPTNKQGGTNNAE